MCRYRTSAESTVSSKENEIDRCICIPKLSCLVKVVISTHEKEIETLKATLNDLNKKLIEREAIQSEHEGVVAGLKDELAVSVRI